MTKALHMETGNGAVEGSFPCMQRVRGILAHGTSSRLERPGAVSTDPALRKCNPPRAKNHGVAETTVGM